MKITIYGMGYIGCVTAATLAREGHSVVGVDVNSEKVEALLRGECPVFEPGLEVLTRRGSDNGTLSATTDGAQALADCDLVMVCVGTPSLESGAIDARALVAVAGEIGRGIRARSVPPLIVIRSTVMPNVIETEVIPALVRASGRPEDAQRVVVNPEFLREGCAIADFNHPPFTLIGAENRLAATELANVYSFLSAPVVSTDRKTALLVKYASNAFHALKISFANEIGTFANALNADGHEVMRVLCMDETLNISRAYLKPGMPFGGSCLPKDVRAVAHEAERRELTLPLLESINSSNRMQIEACAEHILSFGLPRVGLFGLSFKAGTDDLRESPSLAILEIMVCLGLDVAVYDRCIKPNQLVGANRAYLLEHAPQATELLRGSIASVMEESDVLVIATDDPEFERVRLERRPDQALVDFVRRRSVPPSVAPAWDQPSREGWAFAERRTKQIATRNLRRRRATLTPRQRPKTADPAAG